MDAVDILTLKSFIVTLHQLPTISPELQTALQALPSDPKAMLAGIEDIIDQEPLATTYLKYQGLLQSREGRRNKSSEMIFPDDDEPNDEISNTLVAIETQTPEREHSKDDKPIVPSNSESTKEHGNEAVDLIDLFESQTESSLTKMMQEIINSPCQDIKSTINPYLYINPHV